MSSNYLQALQQEADAVGVDPTQPVGYLADIQSQASDFGKAQTAATISQSLLTNPDTYAKQRQAAGRLGVTPAVVEALPNEMDARDRHLQILRDTEKNPTLQLAYSDKDFANLAHDDSGPLREVGLRLEFLGKAAFSGALAMDAAVLKLVDAANPFTLSELDAAELYKNDPAKFKAWQASPAGALSRAAAYYTKGSKDVMASLPDGAKKALSALEYASFEEGKSVWRAGTDAPVRILGDILQSLPQSALLAVTAVLTKNAGATASAVTFEKTGSLVLARAAEREAAIKTMAMLGAAGEGLLGYASQSLQTASEASKVKQEDLEQSAPYKALLAEKVEPEMARTILTARAAEDAGQIAGVVDAVVNFFGGRVLGKIIGEGGTVFSRFRKGGATEALTEGIQSPGETLGQNFAVQKWLNPEQDLSENVLESAAQGLTVGFATGGPITASLTKAAQHHEQIERAQDSADKIRDLFAAATNSKLFVRAPDAFGSLVQQMADNTEGAPKSVFVDANKLNEVLAANPEAAGVFNQMPREVLDQLAEATTAGGAVEIPLGELVAKGTGTALETALLPHVRTTEDGLSATEAEEAAGELKEYLQKTTDQAIAESDNAEVLQESSAKVYDQVLGQLNAIGRNTPRANEAYALLIQSFYTATSGRLGMTPEQMLVKYPLQVKGETVGDGYNTTKLGELSVEGFHFSKEDRPSISTAHFGTGLKGNGRQALLESADERLRKRSYWYVDTGKGISPESGTGGRGHRATLNNIYDKNADPLYLDGKDFESKVLDAGFSGYLDRSRNTVILLGEQDTPVENIGGAYEAKGRVVPPPAPRQGKGRDIIADALQASTVLPGGNLSLEDWATELADKMPEAHAALAKAGVFEGEGKFYRDELVARFKALTPAETYEQRLPTRLPTGKGTSVTVNDDLTTDLVALKQDPKAYAKAVASLVGELGMKPSVEGVDAQAEEAVNRMVDNLLWLHDQIPDSIKQRAKTWYDGGRAIAERWASTYGVSPAQVAGILAALSPQTDWFINVSRAERVLDILHTQTGHKFDKKMKAAAFAFLLADVSKPEEKRVNTAAFEAVKDKTLAEVIEGKDELQLGVWLRAYDEAHHAKEHAIVSPEGAFEGNKKLVSGEDAKSSWGSFAELGKAASVFIDGSPENISRALGDKHKVRNFYNNIFAPQDPDHVTVDTHAVGAMHLRPMSTESPAVKANFSGASSRATGIQGTYPLYHEATARAAAARGVLPREMQSITWEAVRGLFTAGSKRNKEMNAKIDQIWKDVDEGKLSREDARQQVLEAAGGLKVPDWVGGEKPAVTVLRDKTYLRERPHFQGDQLIFEVAPDPANAALVARWNALPTGTKEQVSMNTAWYAAARALAYYGDPSHIKGELIPVTGGWGGDTNPSLALQFGAYTPFSVAREIAAVVGYALSQNSTFIVSPKAFPGGEEMAAISVGLAGVDVKTLYDDIRKNVPGIEGHTSNDQYMGILVPIDQGVAVAEALGAYLDDKHDVHLGKLNAELVEKGKNDYGLQGRKTNGGAGPDASLRKYAAALRSEVTAQLENQLRAAEAGGTYAQSGRPGDGSGRAASGRIAPLEGAPSVPGFHGPDPRLVAVAEQYAKDNGIPLKRQSKYVKVDVVRAERIAQAYDEMEHNPNDPVVKEAYENLIKQTRAQYDALVAAGYSFWFIDLDQQSNLDYVSTPWNAMRDIRANQMMGVFPTIGGFGSDEAVDVSDNPLLADTGLTWPSGGPDGPPHAVTANDLFRAVHDAFGHGLEGAGFRADGEENAWQAHSRLFTGSAIGAITSETRGQNSWLNFGPHGETNRTAKTEDTVFADQKTGLMPSWTWEEGRVGDMQEDAPTETLQQKARGTFNPTTLTISLLESADLSTFLHESGHFFLEVMADIATQENAPQGVVDDFNKILKWFGVKDAATWNALALDAKRPYHERWAESFEQYLIEGKAPTLELRTAFQKFRGWMLTLYRSLKDFAAGRNLKISAEVRGVMDRLLATEDQIAEAEQQADYEMIYKSAEEAGMTEEEWAVYQQTYRSGTDSAIDAMQKRSMADLRWAAEARGKALRKAQRHVDGLRKTMHDQVEEEVMASPIEQARTYLKGVRAKTPEHKEEFKAWQEKRAAFFAAALDEEKAALVEANPDAKGIKKGQLFAKNKRVMDNAAEAKALVWEQENPKPVPVLPAIEMDSIAERFGFTSGDELTKALANQPSAKETIEGITEQRLLEEHGELVTQAGIRAAADEAVHNEARARFVATELATMRNAMNQKEKGLGQRVSVNVLVKAAKDFATAIVGRRKIMDLKPGRYTGAETRAAAAVKKAMAKGDQRAAVTAQRDRLLNLYAAKRTYEAREEMKKAVEYLRKFEKETVRTKLPLEYLDQIDALLERFDLKQSTTLKEIGRRKSLAAWIRSQEELGIEPNIPPELVENAGLTSYKEMTVDEFRGLVDTIKQIEHLARLKNKLLTAKDKREYEAVRDSIAKSVIDNAGGRKADTRTPTTNLGRWFQAVRNFGAAHIKAATWARVMDGGKDGGLMWEYFIRPANEAGDMETTMRAQAAKALHDIVTPWLEGKPAGGKGVYFPSVDRSLNRESILAIALNTGNESNLQRLLGGEGWSAHQLQPILDTLSKSDWKVVQAIWDHFESYRPLIGAKELRVFGKEPEWIAPGSPLTERYGVAGGYYPIKYDPAASVRAEEHNDAEGAKRQLQGAYGAATTKRSFTKGRVEEVVGRPLLYTLSGLYSGVNDVIHDLAWHEWLIDVNRLLKSQTIDAAIREHYGPEAVRQLKSWRDDVAEGDSASQAALDSALSRLRQGVSVAGLGFNVMSAAIQPLGMTQSIVRVGAKWIGKGVLQYVGNPKAATKDVHERSAFMESRARTQFRELNEIRNNVQGQTKAKTAITQTAYFLMMQAQQMVDVPTWLGAYEKAISEGNDDTRSVSLADQAVIDAQGSGQTKDLSAIERGGPAQKLFTVFYSFMNTALNAGVTRAMTSEATAAGRAKLAADMLLLYTVPAVLGSVIKNALTPGDSGDGEDWDKLVKKLLGEQLTFLLGLMVVAREFGDVGKNLLGLSEYQRDYSGPAGLRVIGDANTVAKQIQQGEFDDQLRKAVINLAGSIFGLPAAQANRTITGVKALAEGKTSNPAAVVFGYQEP